MKSNELRVFLQRVTFLIVIVFIGAIGWRFGFFTKDNLNRQTNSAVSTIQQKIPDIPNIPGMGLPGQNHSSASSSSTCRANLQAIHRAKQRALQKEHSAVGTPTWSGINPYLSGNTRCPAGGSYSLQDYQSLPTCSIGGNGTIDRADDHKITG